MVMVASLGVALVALLVYVGRLRREREELKKRWGGGEEKGEEV